MQEMMNGQAVQGTSQPKNESMNQMMQMMMQMMQQMQNNNANAATPAPAQQAAPTQPTMKMKPRIDGSKFGTGILTHMWVGKSLKKNTDGKEANYAYMCVRDELKPLKKVYFTVFDEQLCAAARPFASEQPDPAFDRDGDHPDLFEVQLSAMRADPTAYDELAPYDKMPGFVMMNLPLRKGACYLEDENTHKPMISKRTKKYIIRDHVNVMGIVDYAEVEEDGSLTYHYIKGYDAEEQRDQIEDQFYPKAVNGKSDAIAKPTLNDPLKANQTLEAPEVEIPNGDASAGLELEF